MNEPLVSTPEFVAAAVFAVAVIHTFATGFFARLAHRSERHGGLWHLLSEVEVVFGFWAFVLVAALVLLTGRHDAVEYMESRNFTEPMFVFVIMVIAASRPVLEFCGAAIRITARLTPVGEASGVYFLCLAAVPLLGSFITEPAAMTLAALMLRDGYFVRDLPQRFKYATLGVLFVNVSVGGTLTSFGAPPVLMVAGTWGWDSAFMFGHFGWKAAVAVLLNALAITLFFRKELAECKPRDAEGRSVPPVVSMIHLAFLVGVVVFAHHPAIFMGLFLFFLGYAEAYERHQDKLILREGLLVAFFLAGLVVLGGLQQWWLQRTLVGVEPTLLFFIAMGLTAVTDNAALTYLASLVEGVTPAFQYMIVAGAVTGGGLTIIANAPNPAGIAILKSSFGHESINPLGLFVAALAPTAVAALAFLLL